MPLPVAILCGGLGTRMRPMTESVPKAMISVRGEPFIAHLLRLLAASGVTRVVLCIGYLGESIVDFVGNGSHFGLRVEYSDDGERRLGTAGALKQALPLLDPHFLMTYGDSYLPVDYSAIEARLIDSAASMLMTVWRNRHMLAPSNVAIRNGLIVDYQKDTNDRSFEYIDYGVSGFTKSLFEDVPADVPTDLSSVISVAIAAQTLVAFEVYQRFYEIGSPEGLAETEEYIRAHPLPSRRRK